MEDSAPVVLPIKLTPAQVRPVAYRIISRKHGLNLKSAALDVLSKFLGHHFGADWRGPEAERSLDEISRKWKDEDRGIFVDGPTLSLVIKDWLNAELAATNTADGSETSFDWRQYFKVVNSTDQDKFYYDSSRKNFEIGEDTSHSSFGNAKSLINVFTSRYHILLDKLYRNNMFQPFGIGQDRSLNVNGSPSYTISPIKNMLGRGPELEFFLFGLLEKQEDGPWVFYDHTSSVTLEFTENTVFAPDHYYTSGSFALCHGHFIGNVFQVATLGPPPPETREKSQEAYGNIDFYSLNSSSNKPAKRIERIDPSLRSVLVGEEQRMSDNRIVLVGADLFLDQVTVVDALRRMFTILENDPPIALVLPGSFISTAFQPYMTTLNGRNAAQIYRDGMNTLAELLGQFTQLSSNTKVILIPGPNDPWHSTTIDTLPYKPLPQVFTGRVERAVSDIVFATNPTRLCYLSQEMVLFRSDIGHKFRKHSIDTDVFSEEHHQSSDLPADQTTTTSLNRISELSLDDRDEHEERTADRAAVETMIHSNNNPIAQPIDRSSSDDIQEARKTMATLLDQCHLSPFTLAKSPVLWEYDLTLSLAQWPTSLVVIDATTSAFKQTYEGCHVMNPGAFWHNGRANWLEFWPSSGNFRFADCI